MKTNFLIAALLILLSVCKPAWAAPVGDAPPAVPEPLVKTALLKNTKGEAAGEARLTEVEGGVLITLNLYNLPPGEHAFHLHEKADCSPPESFKNAGGHLNPHEHPHGYMQKGGPHDGDMPNIFVAPDGTLNAHVMNPRITLDEEDKSGRALALDADGAAIVIHAAPDDYMTQPTGNAGDRIACGEVK